VTIVLAGCGSSSKVPTERFIYTSSEDCAAFGKVSSEDCSKAVEKALTEHDKLTIKYPTMLDCEKAEGNDRCERVAERHYRPRLMAFLFTVNNQGVTAVPLYAVQIVAGKSATLFRDANGATYDWERTDGITFSKEAIRKAEGFQPMKRKGA
jgi:uncharacterized protein YgiB involved in biofilm formation